ncbi:MAG: hypothetical protein ABRQ26_08635 [Syntrophomonadaceae bacterium]
MNSSTELGQINQKLDDLFSGWTRDLSTRQDLRETPSLKGWTLNNAEDCDVMYRALYFSGRRYDFYDLIFNSLANQIVLKWLGSRQDLMEDFLRFTAWRICTQTCRPDKLQFLISLFHTDLQEEFSGIINALNLEQCRYIMARTASSQLRDLLRARELNLQMQNPIYGINLWEETHPNLPYPTLHGEKYQLWQEAARRIKLASEGHFTDPFGSERFFLLLECCDQVYRCGLVEDALLMLAELYINYQNQNRLVSVLEDSQIFKLFTRLCRSILPLAVLLGEPYQAYPHALAFWQKQFARLPWDKGSMLYLDMLETIREGLKGQSHQVLWEVLYKSELIRNFQPGDVGPLREEDIQTTADANRLREWLSTARERMATRPHEALTLLEMVRLLHKQGKVAQKNFPAQALMESYLALWQWLPSKLFFNRSLEEHLAPLLGRSLRNKIRRLAEALEQYDPVRIKVELASRPDLFRHKDAWAQREVLLGHFLGVLS